MTTANQEQSGENYINGYQPPVLDFMRRRTLASHGQFIQPLIKPGLRILDLGCGPGHMTLELASRVGFGGSVVGVDRQRAQFEPSQVAAKDLAVKFAEMDAYHLDFEGDSFDGVFSHALFEHLAQPLEGLAEVFRVLKPGGFVGLRSPDWGGVVINPWDNPVEAALAARCELQIQKGGNAYAGRLLGAWLRQAGFTGIKVSASYEIYEDNRMIGLHLADQMEEAGQAQHSATWKKWVENPDALFAQAWFEAVGYKSTNL